MGHDHRRSPAVFRKADLDSNRDQRSEVRDYVLWRDDLRVVPLILLLVLINIARIYIELNIRDIRIAIV